MFAPCLSVLLVGCTSPSQPFDWSTYDGPGAQHFAQEEYQLPQFDDPLEGVNRRIFAFNDFTLTEIVAPAATGYRAVLPRPVRAALGRFFENLLFPGRFVSNALQGEFGGAWDETQRFAVNSTVGVAGLFDVARGWGIEPDDEDLGATFRKWGWAHSTYLMVPVLGASSARDGLGYLLGLGLDPASYFLPVSVLRGFNRLADEVPALAQALQVNYDPYELARLLHHLQRDVATEAIVSVPENDGATETLGAIFLVPTEPTFDRRSETLCVVHPATGREVTYNLWLQDGAAPIDYIIPGLGGHRTSSTALALAEAVFAEGSHAVTICSSMNHEFIESASSVDLPGYLPVDARDTHELLDAIDRDIQRRFPARCTSRRLGGISFGGITTLYIAAAESENNGLVEFAAYLAVNPPLDLRYGVEQIDRFYNAPLEVPAESRARWVESVFAKTLSLADDVLVPSRGALEFSAREARFLIGLTFRAKLREVIMCTQRRKNLGVLHAPLGARRRGAAYREIDQFSLMEYFYAFVLPYYAARDPSLTWDDSGADQLFSACDVRSIGPELRANSKVRVATNRNDFLLAPGDLEWLLELLGSDRVTIFEKGGHLGNLYREDIRRVLAAEVQEAASEP